MNQAPDNQPEEDNENWGLSLRKTIDHGRTFYRYKFWNIAEVNESDRTEVHLISEELFGHLRTLGEYFNDMSAFEMYEIISKLYAEYLKRGDIFAFPEKTIGDQIEEIQNYLDCHPGNNLLDEELMSDHPIEDSSAELPFASDSQEDL